MTAGTNTLRVLHVDDESAVLTATAQHVGHDEDDIELLTETAPSAALDRLETENVDCLLWADHLWDPNSPLGGGQHDGNGVPVVIYAEAHDPAFEAEVLSNGVADYVVKGDGPSHYAVLAARLRNAAGDSAELDRSTEDEHQAFAESLIDSLPDVFYAFDRDGDFIRWNDTFATVTGYSHEEIGTRRPVELLPEDERDAVSEAIQQVIEQERVVRFESAFEHKDGTRIPYEFTAAPLRDREDDVIGITGVGRDIRDRKARERQLETIVENAPVVLFATDSDGVFTFVQGKGMDPIPLDSADLVGESAFEVFGNHPTLPTDLQRALDGEEFRSTVWFAGEAYDIWHQPVVENGEVTQVIAIARLVTDRIEAEQELEASVGILEDLNRIISDPDRDFEKKVTRLLDIGCEFLGLDGGVLTRVDDGRQTVEATARTDVVTVGDAISLRGSHCEQTLQSDGVYTVLDTTTSDQEGALAPASGTYIGAGITVGGEPAGVLCFFGDESRNAAFSDVERRVMELISRWLRTELERRQNRRELETYRQALDTAEDIIYVLDTDGRIRMISDAATEMLGYDPADLVGKHTSEILASEADVERGREVIQEQLGSTDDESTLFEIEIERADGTTYPAEVNMSMLTDDDGRFRGSVGVTRDVSEQRERERRLQTITENIPIVLFALDADGVFTVSRGKGLDVLGLDQREVVGESAFDLYADQPNVKDHIQRALAGEEHRGVVTFGELKFETWYRPVVENGEVTQVVGVSRNVTERERYRDGLSELLSTSRDLMDATSPDAVATIVVEAACDTVGVEYSGLHLHDDATGALERVATCSELEAGGPGPARLEIGQGPAGRAFATDEPVVIEDTGDVEAETGPLESLMYHPVANRGVLCVGTTDQGGFDDSERQLVGLLATTAAAADSRAEREQELDEERAFIESIVNAIPDAFYAFDESGEFYRWNDEVVDVTGYSHEEVAEMRPWEFLPDRDRERVTDTIGTVLETETADRIESHYLTKDGTEIPYEFTGAPLRNADGNVIGLAGVGRDITERKRREEQLRETKQRLDLALEATDTGVWEWTIETDEVIWSDSTHRLFGLEPGQFEGTFEAFTKRIHSDDVDRVQRAFERTLEDNEQFDVEYRVIREDGDIVWVQARGRRQTDDGTDRMVGIITDITERKENELQLRESQEKLQQISENIDDVVWMTSPEKDSMEFVTEAYEDIWGHPTDYLYANPASFVDAIHPDDRERVVDALEAQQSAPDEYAETYRVVQPDGEVRWVRDRSSGVYDEDGTLERIVGIASDVTTRKEREDELRLKTRTMDEAPIGIAITDPAKPDNPMVYVNDAFVSLTGYPREEVLERNCRFLQGEATEPERVDTLRRAIANEEPVGVELRNYRKDGTMFWNQLEIAPVRDDSGAVTNFVGFQQDVTERKERQQELERQNERLELLASTISHDLRNPLRSAKTQLQMAKRECDTDLLDEIEFAHDRMTELIEDLLTLAREGQAVTESESVDVAAIATDSFEGIEAPTATLDAESTSVEADQSRLRQVFENLFTNAISHGREDVTLTVGPTDDGFFVADDGPGIPADEREYVFEYGYSNAETGTGFGLAIVREIAQAHGWSVSVTESDAGGARFEFET